MNHFILLTHSKNRLVISLSELFEVDIYVYTIPTHSTQQPHLILSCEHTVMVSIKLIESKRTSASFGPSWNSFNKFLNLLFCHVTDKAFHDMHKQKIVGLQNTIIITSDEFSVFCNFHFTITNNNMLKKKYLSDLYAK